MSDIDPTTPPQDPGATGEPNQPTATNPQGSGGATDDETVSLSKEDYNNLIAARDRANNNNAELGDVVADLAKDRDITNFLESNKDKFPDLTKEDLMTASSPDELESLATRLQKRYEDVVQKKLMDVQKDNAPVMTPDERAAELKKLKDNPDSGSFQRMLELQQSQ